VVSSLLHPMGQVWVSRSLNNMAPPWLYCQLWHILMTLTCLTKGRDERYFPKLFQSTMWKIWSSQPRFLIIYEDCCLFPTIVFFRRATILLAMWLTACSTLPSARAAPPRWDGPNMTTRGMCLLNPILGRIVLMKGLWLVLHWGWVKIVWWSGYDKAGLYRT